MTVRTEHVELLNAAVSVATSGAADRPRPGQALLSAAVMDAMVQRGHTIGAAPTGLGKALALDTPIATPTGWTTMGELVVGDSVFDETGAPCTVTHAFDVRLGRPCYELTFSDGAVIVADEEHQWATSSRSLRALQSERRQTEASAGARRRLERLEKLEGVRDAIAGTELRVTSRQASTLLSGICDPSTVASARKSLGPVRLHFGQAFELEPVLDKIISNLSERCSLRKSPPPAFEVVTTAQMAASLHASDGALNHAVGVAGPLDLPARDLPIDPYVLGYWLGDGSSNSGSITVGYEDVSDTSQRLSDAWAGSISRVDRPACATLTLRQQRPDLCPFGHSDWRQAQSRSNRVCRTCASAALDRNDSRRWNECLATKLRRARLINDKHIPTDYLRGSVDQRLSLLQGLLDSDGSVTVNGTIEISLCNERLINQVAELVRTLGIRTRLRSGPATITESDPLDDQKTARRTVGTRWRLTFTTGLEVFRLRRKADRHLASRRVLSPLKLKSRYLTAATPVPTVPVRCITVDSPNHLFLAGEHLVPTHNSISYLVPAGVAAIVDGERTVVSTEGLALQSQIVDKDLPSVSEAAEKVLGRPLRFAVHKGWANYGCALKATQVAEFFAPPASIRTVAQSRDALIEYGRKRGFLDETGNATGNIVGAPRPYDSDGDDLADSRIVPLAAWVLGTSVDGTPGDRRDIPETISDEPSWREWGALSVSSAECLGDECPFYGEECRPAAARRLVADADIVVTNHSMLAIQAAAAVPVIIGSNRIGPIRHVVIDEAHTLSSVVRDHGAIEMAGKSIISIIRGAERILNTVDPTVSALITEGRRLADDFDDALAAWARSHGKANPKLGKDDDPLAAKAEPALAWLRKLETTLRAIAASAGTVKDRLARRRLGDRIVAFRGDLRLARQHLAGYARWIEPSAAGNPTIKVSPVQVGWMLRDQTWTAPIPVGLDTMTGRNVFLIDELGADGSVQWIPDSGTLYDGASDPNDPESWEILPRYQLSVSAVSATMPDAFDFEIGLRAPTIKYQSPFESAYSKSLHFSPKVDRQTAERIGRPARDNKFSLDVDAHAEWAAELMGELVTAAGGRTLVLSATRRSGEVYARSLRSVGSAGGWATLSQWDPASREQLIDRWKHDETAVLVGTRSFMTGLDAPGATCSLVIVDRIPRAAGNPVDDARKEAIAADRNINEWMADTEVYVRDAALLLEQAAGRLIRSVNDVGMVAVLDPRLAKGSLVTMAEAARRIYINEALGAFTNRTADLGKAIEFLQQRRALAAAA